MTQDNLIKLFTSVLPGLVGGIVVALVNQFFTWRKTGAEAKKLDAETDAIRAETQLMLAEVQKAASTLQEATYQLNRNNEALITMEALTSMERFRWAGRPVLR